MKSYLKLLLRHKWILAFFSVIIGFCVLSFSCNYYCNLYAGDWDTIHFYMLPNFHLIVSVMSIWWTVLFFSGFISEPGNELIFLGFNTNCVIGFQLFLEMLYMISVSLYFFMERDLYQLPVSLLYFLMAESFFMNGIAFLLIQLTRNISLALGGVVVYCVFLLKFDQMDILGKISIFADSQEILQISVRKLLIDLGLAIAFHVIGEICFRKRKVYF